MILCYEAYVNMQPNLFCPICKAEDYFLESLTTVTKKFIMDSLKCDICKK